VKGLLLLGLAFGILSFLHKDLDVIVGNWIAELGMDMENPHVVTLLEKLDLITDRQLGQWSIVTFCFSGVFLTEGAGLLLRQQWAKYLTVAATGVLIPIEAYAIIHHFSLLKLGVLIVNLAVLGLLVVQLRREHRHAKPMASAIHSKKEKVSAAASSFAAGLRVP